MAETYSLEDKGSYYLLSNLDFETENFRDIFPKISETTAGKKQDVVLSLDSVGVLYSSHLAVFVRLHQLIQKNGNRFIITDVSPEIKNLLQITQLDSIFAVYDNLEDFIKTTEKGASGDSGQNRFEWSVSPIDRNSIKVLCSGNMRLEDQLNELQKSIIGFFSIEFDFSKLKSIDSGSADIIGKLTNNHSVSVSGASGDLLERFRQEHIYGKVKLK